MDFGQKTNLLAHQHTTRAPFTATNWGSLVPRLDLLLNLRLQLSSWVTSDREAGWCFCWSCCWHLNGSCDESGDCRRDFSPPQSPQLEGLLYSATSYNWTIENALWFRRLSYPTHELTVFCSTAERDVQGRSSMTRGGARTPADTSSLNRFGCT